MLLATFIWDKTLRPAVKKCSIAEGFWHVDLAYFDGCYLLVHADWKDLIDLPSILLRKLPGVKQRGQQFSLISRSSSIYRPYVGVTSVITGANLDNRLYME